MDYPIQTIHRAARAIQCSPFKVKLFVDMRSQGVSLQQIIGSSGVEQQYTQQPLTELAADNALLWLVKVGLLRREVDGQGLTDSFRLTPLGRQLLEQWQTQTWAPPTFWERLQNTLMRWLWLPV
jgi:hypothetical protein